ncbi:MAG: hypothetical protein DMF61_08375 [Blastocatellia bacterium AA13]|nr:MAG: hypothetical protein DMF61_08375 [Blastocatellia bacterium AA13]
MAVTTLLLLDKFAAESSPQTLIVEVPSGLARHRWLEQFLEARSAPQSRGFCLSCDFDSGGPWGGVSALFAELLPAIQKLRPDLIERHSFELVCIIPELKRTLTVRNPNLTDLASPEERTRNYPADRAFRVVHGLIDLLDAWKVATEPESQWLIGCDEFDLAGAMSRCFFAELMRRGAGKLHLFLLAMVEPGSGNAQRSSFNSVVTTKLRDIDTPLETKSVIGKAEAEALAIELEEKIGDDRLEMQIHLQELIRLWSLAERPDKLLKPRFFALETYDTQGLYQDALGYGRGLLETAREYAPDDVQFQWKILLKLLTSHIGLQNVEASFALAKGEGMRLAGDNYARRAYLFHLVAMLYARFSKPRDLNRGEEYLNLALEAIESANLENGKYHFQYVFNRNGLAMIRNFQGRFEDAIELCRTGIVRLNQHLAPDEHRLYRSILLYNIAQVYFAIGANEEAVKYYSSTIEMDPNYSEYYNERGNTLLRLGRLQEALEDYLRAVELSPPYFEVFANIGQCCRRMGRMSEAIETYSRALDLQPNHLLALLGRGKANEELGNRDAAIADYTAAFTQDSTQWEAVASRGVLYYEAGELEASLIDLNTAIKLKPDNADLYHNRSVVLADLGRYHPAEEDIEAAMHMTQIEQDKLALQTLLDSVRERSHAGQGMGS